MSIYLLLMIAVHVGRLMLSRRGSRRRSRRLLRRRRVLLRRPRLRRPRRCRRRRLRRKLLNWLLVVVVNHRLWFSGQVVGGSSHRHLFNDQESVQETAQLLFL